jgi:hypothetical protein
VFILNSKLFPQFSTSGSGVVLAVLARIRSNIAQTCPNIVQACPNPAQTCPNPAQTCPNLAQTCPNLAQTCPNLAQTCPNLAQTCPVSIVSILTIKTNNSPRRITLSANGSE